jgi:FkbM family methyltransferase
MIENVSAQIKRWSPAVHGAIRALARGVLISPWSIERCPPIPRSIDGHWFLTHPRFLSETVATEDHVRKAMREHLVPGGHFIDVGAYVGWHTLLASRLVGRSGRVTSYEPSPSNYAYLKYHVNWNARGKVRLRQAAVAESSCPSQSFFLLNRGDSSSNSLTFGERSVPGAQEVSVSTTTLDQEMADVPAAKFVLKIDVEGSELSVLMGAAEFLRRLRPVVILALHPQWLPLHHSTGRIRSFFEECGYRVNPLDGAAAGGTWGHAGDYLCLPPP